MDLINNLQENEKHNIDCLVAVALKYRNNPAAIVSFYFNDFGYGYAGTCIKAPEKIAKGIVEKDCPKCKEGKLVLRKSIYGSFYGCSRFPKCRNTEKLKEDS